MVNRCHSTALPYCPLAHANKSKAAAQRGARLFLGDHSYLVHARKLGKTYTSWGSSTTQRYLVQFEQKE